MNRFDSRMQIVLGHSATRRNILKTAAVGVSMPFVSRLALGQSRTLNVASYGGSWGDALKKAWLDPFEKEKGIKVNLGVNASLALAKLQTMNPNGAEWDIVDLTWPEYRIAVRDNLILPVDPKRVDTSQIFPEYVRSHGFGYALFLYVMAWDKRKFPEGPNTWVDFWNTSKFAGKRSLWTVRSSGASLISALLADGVPVNQIDPPNIERALKSLEKLGKNNIVWATTNQEPVQSLISGETPLAALFVGRAIMSNRGGSQIGFTVNQAIIGGDAWSVIRNAKNSAEAFEFMNFVATRGDRAAELTALTGYEVPHKDLGRLLSADATDVRPALAGNPELKDKVHIQDDLWWSQNLEAVATRFKEWQLQ